MKRSIPGFPGYSITDDGRVFDSDGKALVITIPAGKGYVSVTLRHEGKSKKVSLHQLLGLAFLPRREGDVVVRHLDDNKLNNRLDNLKWGTHSDNAFDRSLNGIAARQVITAEQAVAIKYRIAAGERCVDIAKEYGMKEQSVAAIKHGQSWTHVGGPTVEEMKAIGRNQSGGRNNSAKLTDAKVAEIRRRLAAGERGKDLAVEYNVSKTTISEIKNGKHWV